MATSVSRPRVTRITLQSENGFVTGATATASYDVSLGEDMSIEAQITIDAWTLLTQGQKKQLQSMVTKVLNALPEV